MLLFIFFLTLGSLAPSNSAGGIGGDDAQVIIVALATIWMIAGSLIATGVAAVSITAEVDADTLDGLLMSGLRPSTILRGKATAAIRFSGRPLLIGAIALVILSGQIFTNLDTAILLLTGVISVAIMVLLCTTIGVWVSVRAKSAGMALVSAYGLVALVTLSPLFLHAMAREWTRRLQFPNIYGYEMLLLNPITSYAANLREFTHNSEPEVYLLVWFLCSMLHLAGIGMIYYLAERRIARMVTRDV